MRKLIKYESKDKVQVREEAGTACVCSPPICSGILYCHHRSFGLRFAGPLLGRAIDNRAKRYYVSDHLDFEILR